MDENTHLVYWGDVHQEEAAVRLPPGMRVDTHVQEVEGVSPVHVDGDMLPHPPEWAHLKRLLPDVFNVFDHGDTKRLSKDEIVVHIAAGLTEAFVHELMEWIAVDGQRAFNPHPVIDDRPDTHWKPIAMKLREFYADLLASYPDSGWSGQNDSLDNDQEVK